VFTGGADLGDCKYGIFNAGIGVICNINDEQYFWYQFWFNRMSYMQVDKNKPKVTIIGDDETWIVTPNCIQHNGEHITPYFEFTNRRDTILMQSEGYSLPLLRRFVIMSMIMDNNVLY
jgi:hypothetical protein